MQIPPASPLHPNSNLNPNDVRFTSFDISDSLKNRLTNAGFTIPTPVQAKAIPPALGGADILATASTGTGKTLSFLIPMIERMDANSVPSTRGKRGPIRALILLPTRELAMQVLEAYWKLVPGSKNDAVLVCGGLSENNQLDQLDRGPRLVVATPGRLEDFLRRREININSVEMLVLDEVDRMLDMGFLPAIRRIVGAVPKTRQTMCYSATLDANIREIVRDYVNKPVRIEIGQTSKPSDQRRAPRLHRHAGPEARPARPDAARRGGNLPRLLPHQARRRPHLEEARASWATTADVIHGDRSQSQRTAALKGFQNGKHRVLVATDVAARGIDVHDIAHVVNYDLPNASDDFVHRIGRTGRAGAKGVATTFVMPQEKHDARKLERELKIKFEWREADKNLEKELRNQPLDTTAQGQNLMQLETRSWRGNDPVAPMAASPSPYKSAKGSGNGRLPWPQQERRRRILRWTQLRRTRARLNQPSQQPPRQQPLRPSPPRSITKQSSLRSASQPAAERSRVLPVFVLRAVTEKL